MITITCTKWKAKNAYLFLTVCGCWSLGLRWLWGRVSAVGTILQPRPTNRIQRRILIKDGQVHTAIKQLHDVCVCEGCKLVWITYSIIIYHAWRISVILYSRTLSRAFRSTCDFYISIEIYMQLIQHHMIFLIWLHNYSWMND